jgi:hypothetical protein
VNTIGGYTNPVAQPGQEQYLYQQPPPGSAAALQAAASPTAGWWQQQNLTPVGLDGSGTPSNDPMRVTAARPQGFSFDPQYLANRRRRARVYFTQWPNH